MNLITFVVILTQTLNWHPQRSLTFAHIVASLLDQRNVQHHALIQKLNITNSTIKSKLERVRRFFANQFFDYDLFIKNLVLQTFNGIPKMDLILDRTNWKYGKTDINYLVLVARIGKITIPLFWSMIPHQGTSNATQRIELMGKFKEVFGLKCIRSFTADREFIGEEWLTYLYEQKIPFYIRLKDNRLVEWGNQKKKLGEFFEHLETDKERHLYKKINELCLTIVGKKLNDEYLVICSNVKDHKRVLKEYKMRWHIETCFKNMKTQGFNIENTHMKSLDRLMKLMAAVAVALLLASLMGVGQKCVYKKTVKTPLYSIFTRGVRYIKQVLMTVDVGKCVALAVQLLISEG